MRPYIIEYFSGYKGDKGTKGDKGYKGEKGKKDDYFFHFILFEHKFGLQNISA